MEDSPVSVIGREGKPSSFARARRTRGKSSWEKQGEAVSLLIIDNLETESLLAVGGGANFMVDGAGALPC